MCVCVRICVYGLFCFWSPTSTQNSKSNQFGFQIDAIWTQVSALGTLGPLAGSRSSQESSKVIFSPTFYPYWTPTRQRFASSNTVFVVFFAWVFLHAL